AEAARRKIPGSDGRGDLLGNQALFRPQSATGSQQARAELEAVPKRYRSAGRSARHHGRINSGSFSPGPMRRALRLTVPEHKPGANDQEEHGRGHAAARIPESGQVYPTETRLEHRAQRVREPEQDEPTQQVHAQISPHLFVVPPSRSALVETAARRVSEQPIEKQVSIENRPGRFTRRGVRRQSTVKMHRQARLGIQTFDRPGWDRYPQAYTSRALAVFGQGGTRSSRPMRGSIFRALYCPQPRCRANAR